MKNSHDVNSLDLSIEPDENEYRTIELNTFKNHRMDPSSLSNSNHFNNNFNNGHDAHIVSNFMSTMDNDAPASKQMNEVFENEFEGMHVMSHFV